MKVKELIHLLQQCDAQNAEVLLSCDEEGNRFETVGHLQNDATQHQQVIILYPSGLEVDL